MLGAASPQKCKNNQNIIELCSSDPNKPLIQIMDISIRPESDPFDKTKQYVGLIIYLMLDAKVVRQMSRSLVI